VNIPQGLIHAHDQSVKLVYTSTETENPKLTAGSIPPELLRLANDVVRDLHTAQTHIKSQNYGIAADWIDAALRKLPADNGPYYDWAELERRTS
jgi:hypothetical protein